MLWYVTLKLKNCRDFICKLHECENPEKIASELGVTPKEWKYFSTLNDINSIGAFNFIFIATKTEEM
jgi:hypothetical protein